MDGWDVFVSYCRADNDRVQPLVGALRERGLTTFVDESGVHDFHSISETLIRELGRSKVMLVFYSDAYPERPACQAELVIAFLTAQREGDPRRRILVVNPESHRDHIEPMELREARHWISPGTPDGLRRLAESVAERVAAAAGPMSSITGHPRPRWVPASAGVRSPGFAGRISELWQIHSALNPVPLMNGPATRMAQIRGIGGIGKTLLAEEYALRYDRAYPGGIFWLDLGDNVARSYRERLSVIARALHVSGSGPIEDILNRLAGKLTKPYLWIVDNVPPGLPTALVRQLRAPGADAATLWTTRSRAYEFESIELGPVRSDDGYTIVTSYRSADKPPEHHAAQEIVRGLGGHPLALSLIAGGSRVESFSDLRDRPPPPELTEALLPDFTALGAPARDVLRIIALLHPAPADRTRLVAAIAHAEVVSRTVASRLATSGLHELMRTCMLTGDRDGWTVPSAVALTVLNYDPDQLRLDRLAGTLKTSGEAHMQVTVTDEERRAAFQVQVELVTRVGVQPLPDGQGSLREALASLYSLSQTARSVMGSASGSLHPVLGELIIEVLRPFLTRWHYTLQTWEEARPAGVGAAEHEQSWSYAVQLRTDLAALREPLLSIARRLAAISGSSLGIPG